MDNFIGALDRHEATKSMLQHVTTCNCGHSTALHRSTNFAGEYRCLTEGCGCWTVPVDQHGWPVGGSKDQSASPGDAGAFISDERAIANVIDHCREVLVEKAKGYAQPGKLFLNFEHAPCVVAGQLTPIQYAWVLANKHVDALARLLAAETHAEYEQRGGDAALQERMGDVVNFGTLILAMLARDPGRYAVVKKEGGAA